MKPYIHIESHPVFREKLYSFFALKVVSIMDKSAWTREPVNRNIGEQINLFQSMLQGKGNQSIELRYVVVPNRKNWMQGRISLNFICRNMASSKKEAVKYARNMWENLIPALHMETDNYEILPIEGKKEFHAVWTPFQIQDMAELARREEPVSMDNGEKHFMPCPFVLNKNPSDRLPKGLLAQNTPLIYSISLMPAKVTILEKQYMKNPLASNLARLGFTGNQTDMSAKVGVPSNGIPTDKSTYLIKIHVASDRQIATSTLDLIGNEITAPTSTFLESFRGRESKFLQGGYVWHKASATNEFNTAYDNLRYHNANSWLRSSVPKKVSRIRYIFDPVETATVFRLPRVFNNTGLPGLSVRPSLPPTGVNYPSDGILLGIKDHTQ